MDYCVPLARINFSLEIFPPKSACDLSLLLKEILQSKFQPTFISVTCGSNLSSKRISQLISTVLVRYLSMWSLMYHVISINVTPKETTSFLTLSGDRYTEL
ncbi:MAG: methylenetetrahydrofolate reductase, partial [Candidatus Hodgkinia cicadicola]